MKCKKCGNMVKTCACKKPMSKKAAYTFNKYASAGYFWKYAQMVQPEPPMYTNQQARVNYNNNSPMAGMVAGPSRPANASQTTNNGTPNPNASQTTNNGTPNPYASQTTSQSSVKPKAKKPVDMSQLKDIPKADLGLSLKPEAPVGPITGVSPINPPEPTFINR